ncbi:MAG TPA: alpha/beta fold hydrolase [Acidimicrobiales bacterium]|nr:alpha/beta fold hydrolase [Acidimicrobiales bacterium]
MAGPARRDVTFDSGATQCAAWLYMPETGAGDLPCVVMAPGLSAVREQRLDAFAERFVSAGLAALVFDYRHFGSSGGEPRQLLDVARQVGDWKAAIAFARSLPGIDAGRIALWGTSLSGGHVMAVASRDARIAAVVAQMPFTDGIANAALYRVSDSLRLTIEAVRDRCGAWLGRPPRLIGAAGAPGSLAVLTTPDALAGFEKMESLAPTWRNELAARVMLRLVAYRPGRLARRIECPLLVCVGDNDVVVPQAPAVAAARRAPKGELLRYPVGHFDAYVGEPFERLVEDETLFLTRVLLPAAV